MPGELRFDTVEAHEFMESNQGAGKIVVLT